MRGLCHVCHTSNVEVTILDGVVICKKCRNERM